MILIKFGLLFRKKDLKIPSGQNWSPKIFLNPINFFPRSCWFTHFVDSFILIVTLKCFPLWNHMQLLINHRSSWFWSRYRLNLNARRKKERSHNHSHHHKWNRNDEKKPHFHFLFFIQNFTMCVLCVCMY